MSNDTTSEVIVKNVRAVNGLEIDKVADEIFTADIMATAVGVNVLPEIVKPICAGLKKRFNADSVPLNIIICENLINADKYLRTLIEQEMGAEFKVLLDKKLGLIEASIGRMVPIMTDEMREDELLKIWVEPYSRLPVDKDAFIGEIPDLNGLVPFSPFGFYIKRKLFIHNLGHAMCAYLGWQKGYSYINECVKDEAIREVTCAAMQESASALNREYAIQLDTLDDHIADLLFRFDNRALGDTVVRAGRDPIRKLGIGDRLTGAAVYCQEQGVIPEAILEGIGAGLKYDNKADESAVRLQSLIKVRGIQECVRQVCGLDSESFLFKLIVNQFHQL